MTPGRDGLGGRTGRPTLAVAIGKTAWGVNVTSALTVKGRKRNFMALPTSRPGDPKSLLPPARCVISPPVRVQRMHLIALVQREMRLLILRAGLEAKVRQ